MASSRIILQDKHVRVSKINVIYNASNLNKKKVLFWKVQLKNMFVRDAANNVDERRHVEIRTQFEHCYF